MEKASDYSYISEFQKASLLQDLHLQLLLLICQDIYHPNRNDGRRV